MTNRGSEKKETREREEPDNVSAVLRVPQESLQTSVRFTHPAGYVLWWEVSGAESSREERSLSNSTLQYRLTGLTSTTAYALQVAALTAAGRGVVTPATISTGVPPDLCSAMFSKYFAAQQNWEDYGRALTPPGDTERGRGSVLEVSGLGCDRV
ncbi:Protein sidekick-1 [Liparis tanakae]|uniref:Protein sidekick-1 n=1 Tax=Liparis tanakae TaxID=230148 RepID=A0A4Z2EUG6_9TELE|nr:Protein sidekick-1 [Liparis tanakae]